MALHRPQLPLPPTLNACPTAPSVSVSCPPSDLTPSLSPPARKRKLPKIKNKKLVPAGSPPVQAQADLQGGSSLGSPPDCNASPPPGLTPCLSSCPPDKYCNKDTPKDMALPQLPPTANARPTARDAHACPSPRSHRRLLGSGYFRNTSVDRLLGSGSSYLSRGRFDPIPEHSVSYWYPAGEQLTDHRGDHRGDDRQPSDTVDNFTLPPGAAVRVVETGEQVDVLPTLGGGQKKKKIKNKKLDVQQVEAAGPVQTHVEADLVQGGSSLGSPPGCLALPTLNPRPLGSLSPPPSDVCPPLGLVPPASRPASDCSTSSTNVGRGAPDFVEQFRFKEVFLFLLGAILAVPFWRVCPYFRELCEQIEIAIIVVLIVRWCPRHLRVPTGDVGGDHSNSSYKWLAPTPTTSICPGGKRKQGRPGNKQGADNESGSDNVENNKSPARQ